MHPLHNFLEPIRHIISIKFQSVYPLLYYAKLKLFCTGLQQTKQGVYNHVELFFACCDVVHPLHYFLEPIRHIISIKFQSVYPLLYYTKLKRFCTGLQQTQQGVYNHVELFSACCDVVHPLHNFLEPIRHIIFIKFQCLPTFVLRETQTFLHRYTANTTRCLQSCRVVFCLLWCCAPFEQLSIANKAHNFHKISKCLPTFVLRETQTFLHTFTANTTRCLQSCRVVFCLLWCCAPFAQLSRANKAHNFHQISKCLPTFVLRETQTFLHRFTANTIRCLQSCRIVFCLLWCCAPFAKLSRANKAHNFHKISKCLPTFVLRETQTFLHTFTANTTRCLQSCRVVFFLLWCCAPFAQLSRANKAHNFHKISKCLPTFVLRETQTFLHRFTANTTRCLQSCRVVFCLLWCCAPFAQLSRANKAHNFHKISKCLPTFILRETQTFLHRFTANTTRCL